MGTYMSLWHEIKAMRQIELKLCQKYYIEIQC